MNRDEAKKMIGKTVCVKTQVNGDYVGVLETVDLNVEAGRQWRGNVRITGVLKVAMHVDFYSPYQDIPRYTDMRIWNNLNIWSNTTRWIPTRSGGRPGMVMDAAGGSISATTETGTDYKTALEASIAAHETKASELRETMPHRSNWEAYGPHSQAFRKEWELARAERIALGRELRRLKTGRWNEFPDDEPALLPAEAAIQHAANATRDAERQARTEERQRRRENALVRAVLLPDADSQAAFAAGDQPARAIPFVFDNAKCAKAFEKGMLAVPVGGHYRIRRNDDRYLGLAVTYPKPRGGVRRQEHRFITIKEKDAFALGLMHNEGTCKPLLIKQGQDGFERLGRAFDTEPTPSAPAPSM